MSAPKVLVVDDGDRYVELFHALLRDYRYATRCELEGPCWTCPHRAPAEGPRCELTHAHDWAETEQALARHRDLDVVLLDVTFDLPASRLLPRGDDLDDLETRRREQGLAILERLRTQRPELPVVLMTSARALQADTSALQADEWVTFAGEDAFDARALGLLVERILARRSQGESRGYLFGQSPAMASLRRDARVLARTSLPVLVQGETGTGKSALAERVLHAESGRSGPFVAVDLSALPETLVAAELFGTTRGAYSGATDRPGRFEQASGGTLFLDEIGNLPKDLQRLLLLVLQEGKVTRLGENAPRAVDVRVVVASHVDLADAVRRGRFRADLYARLNPASRLRLPPLRERTEDLEEFVARFVRRHFERPTEQALLARYVDAANAAGDGDAAIDGARAHLLVEAKAPRHGVGVHWAPALFEALRRHEWPGNVRELELLVATACSLALADALEAAERGRPGPLPSVITVPARLVSELIARSWVAAAVGEDAEEGGFELVPREQLRDVSRDLERRLFLRLFQETDGDFERMAARLLIGDPTDNARRVRMRFNQLGLRARELK